MKQQENHSQAAVLGLQHLLAMYSGSILVPIMIASALGYSAQQLTYLISTDIFMCGVATLLQLQLNKHFGVGLPIVLGVAFQSVAPLIMIGQSHGSGAMFGALIASVITSSLSSAALRPTSGCPPAPSPRVNLGPSWITVSAFVLLKACTSVLAAMNSTPETPSSTMRLMAFPPPPPTPITLITAPCAAAVSNENVIFIFLYFIRQTCFQSSYGNDLLIYLCSFLLIEEELLVQQIGLFQAQVLSLY